MLIQCSYSALIVLIQFGRFIPLFRVFLHAKIFSLRTAEPYPFIKKISILSLSGRQWLIRSKTALLIPSNDLSVAFVSLKVFPLSNGISKLIQVLSVQKKTFNPLKYTSAENDASYRSFELALLFSIYTNKQFKALKSLDTYN